MPSEPPSHSLVNNHTNVTIVSQSTVFPIRESTTGPLKLSVSDLPMLSCHYIQKGNLFFRPPLPLTELISILKTGLSKTLAHFPALAGRLITDSDGYVYIDCNDAGVDFLAATAKGVSIKDILSPVHIPDVVNEFFTFDRMVSYDGHFKPILAVQVTELNDGVFIGCSVNHAVVDGTSLWNFFNSFAEMTRGVKRISNCPDFTRDSVLISSAVLRVPKGGPKVTFSSDQPIKQRIFSFSREAMVKLKDKVNNLNSEDEIDLIELMGKQSNDTWNGSYDEDNLKMTSKIQQWLRNAVSKQQQPTTMGSGIRTKRVSAAPSEISSFQSLCALLWRCVTKARNLNLSKTTTFRMAVNCRHRVEPKMDPLYFGNAIQSVPTVATTGDVITRDLRWCAEQLNKSVLAHNDNMVRKAIGNWESDPKCFPLGNFDGAMITMGSSPRFPMFDNDFGWGKPVAIRSGRANKFDGKMSAFPGRYGGGSVDLEVVLCPETMAALESDLEFMQYVSVY